MTFVRLSDNSELNQTPKLESFAADRFKGGQYNHWDMKQLGIKANLPDLLAAILPRQIREIDERLPVRQRLCDRYRSAFKDTGIRLVQQVDDCVDACHLFTIGVPANIRDKVINILNENGISVTVNFRALPDLAYYASRNATCYYKCYLKKWHRLDTLRAR